MDRPTRRPTIQLGISPLFELITGYGSFQPSETRTEKSL